MQEWLRTAGQAEGSRGCFQSRGACIVYGIPMIVEACIVYGILYMLPEPRRVLDHAEQAWPRRVAKCENSIRYTYDRGTRRVAPPRVSSAATR